MSFKIKFFSIFFSESLVYTTEVIICLFQIKILPIQNIYKLQFNLKYVQFAIVYR